MPGILFNPDGTFGINATGGLILSSAYQRCCCDCRCYKCESSSAFPYTTRADTDEVLVDIGTITPAAGASSQTYYPVLQQLIADCSNQTLVYSQYRNCVSGSGWNGWWFVGKTVAQLIGGGGYTWGIKLAPGGICRGLPGCGTGPPSTYPDKTNFSLEIYLISFLASNIAQVGDQVPCALTETPSPYVTQTLWARWDGLAVHPCSDDLCTMTATDTCISTVAGSAYIDTGVDYSHVLVTHNGYGPCNCQDQPTTLTVTGTLCGGATPCTLTQQAISCADPVYYDCRWTCNNGEVAILIEPYTGCRWRMLINVFSTPFTGQIIAYRYDGQDPIGNYGVEFVNAYCPGVSIGDIITVT